MPTPISFLTDESVLDLYDALGVDFWARVLTNTQGVIKPLQQDVKFAQKFDATTLKIYLTTEEEKRVQDVFGTLSDILDDSSYKHTPFMHYAGSAKEVRFTFDPSLVRFTFQPEAMLALTDIAHKGGYLAAIRELLELLDDVSVMKGVALALDRKNFNLMGSLQEVLASLKKHQVSTCSEKELSLAMMNALGDTETQPGLRLAAPALQAGLEDDAMLAANLASVNKTDRLRVLMEEVVAFVKREESREGML